MGTVNVTEERVELTAVDKMSAVMKQAQSQVKDLRSAIDTARNALAAVGVTVGVGAMLSLAHDILKANAALDDFATSTGASVENLSALQRVARVGGRDFDFITDSMGKMIKGLKGADESGQNAAHALEFLGIKAKNADGTFRDQAQVMTEIAIALAKYEDSGNKTALVQDLYGKGAQRLLPFLKDLANETDRHATVTARQAAQAKEAEENINRLNVVMAEGRRELVIQFTPAIIEFTEKLLAASKASGGLFSGLFTMSRERAGDFGTRMKEIDSQLAMIAKGKSEPGTFQVGMAWSEKLLRQDREYLLFLQRQQALAGAGDQNLDARDLRMRQKYTLDYQTPKKGQDKVKGLSPYDQEVLALQQRSALEDSGSSEFMKTSLAVKAGKYNTLDEVTGKVRTLTEAEKQYLLQLAAAADTEKSYKELRDEKLKADVEISHQLDAETAKRAADKQAIVDMFTSEEELAKQHYEKLLEMLRVSVADDDQYMGLSFSAYLQYQEKLTSIADGYAQKRYQINKVYHQLDLESTGQFLNYVAGMMNSKNREMFEIGKVAAIANTIVRTYSAAMGAFESLSSIPYVGYALGAAAAAAVVVTGLANVQQIQATQFGGATGATPTFAANPSTGLPTGAPAPPPAAAPAGISTIVHLHGDSFGADQVRALIDEINQNTRDGGRIVLA